jgi:mRNA-degrading endonuclease RelE of RelBE toxin-antitoxin system
MFLSRLQRGVFNNQLSSGHVRSQPPSAAGGSSPHPATDPELKRKARAALADMLDDPTGKALKDELEGYWSLRMGRSRIIYRFGEGAVEIVAIGPREIIYEAAARQIRRDPEKS